MALTLTGDTMLTVNYGYGRVVPVEDVLTSVGKGWWPLVTKLIEDLYALGWNGELHQLKEKFGGLRFYTGELTNEMFERICEAEAQAVKTCEECGALGKQRGGGWIRTLCDEHNDKGMKQ